ncbi:thiamine biosynthesis protein [Corynebacterium sp. HS2168-gen11]|uniref:thiamine biosynthesis protein n=1 Tax=Corynebacterium sp. HS2168-gen11 TaxID=2974027 RepID=UPI00216B39B9|nr:thiamine biosynthesis protein [Corynebacterium sp. HS2168-gen11]MCS4535416.1 thiamine biosynthesis protein [Corynebacterium sp. HS2168-gen11]
MSRATRMFMSLTALSTAIILSACSPALEVDSTVKIDTAVSLAPQPSMVEAIPYTETSEVTISLDATEFANGDTLTASLSGLSPKMGYYAAICAQDSGKVPACTGELTDAATAAWITSDTKGTVALTEEGNATVTLTATAVGEDVDCTTESCVFKVFGDHSSGFTPVAEVPISFAS